MKPFVRCELIEFKEIATAGKPHVYRAHIHRTSPHPKLGADRPGQVTVTSMILRIDFEAKVFETLNTIYAWGV